MNRCWGIYRITNSKVEISMEKAQRDAAAALVINVLREPMPDTFLGRKHYERTPLPHEIDLTSRLPQPR
jgi:hypothetical protein